MKVGKAQFAVPTSASYHNQWRIAALLLRGFRWGPRKRIGAIEENEFRQRPFTGWMFPLEAVPVVIEFQSQGKHFGWGMAFVHQLYNFPSRNLIGIGINDNIAARNRELLKHPVKEAANDESIRNPSRSLESVIGSGGRWVAGILLRWDIGLLFHFKGRAVGFDFRERQPHETDFCSDNFWGDSSVQ